jgi:hypothetical protein
MLRTVLAVALAAMVVTAGGVSADGLSGDDTIAAGYGTDGHDSGSTMPVADGFGLDQPGAGAEDANPLVVGSGGGGPEPAENTGGSTADPLAVDLDDDGLPDGKEVLTYDTDPTGADTDGDGLPDAVELSDHPAMQDADPNRFDVFVEIDYMEGERPSDEAIDLLVEEFANAPVENPDGSTGITLHVVVDDAIPRESGTSFDERDRMMAEHMDYDGKGYRYGIVVVDARHGDKNVFGFSDIGGNNGAMVMERLDPALHQANHMMHELGHSLGLAPSSYRGIDSRETGYDEYSSVMNYNSGRDVLGYSEDEPFDDWAYIAEHVYTPPTDEIEGSG